MVGGETIKQMQSETGCKINVSQASGADIERERVQKSALVEQSSSTKYHICLENAKILSKEDNYFKRKLKEAITINYHPINLNRDDGWSINHSWCPLLDILDSLHVGTLDRSCPT